MPSRRQVLLGMGSAFGLASSVIAWRFLHATDAEAIVMILRKRLHYLKLDEATLNTFALDFAASKQITAKKMRLIPAVGALYNYLPDNHNLLFDAIRHGEDRIVTSFLLSSDFFINGADENRIVRYLGKYDPLRACGTPFARPVDIGKT